MSHNYQYGAELRRSTKGGAWSVTQLKPEDKDVRERILWEHYCPWMLMGEMRLYQCLKEAGFVFTRVEELQGAPRTSLLRAHFVYDEIRYALHIKKSGHIDFEPAYSYRPLSYRFDIKSKNEEGGVRGFWEYDSSEGIPVLKAMTDEAEIRVQKKGLTFLVFGKQITTFAKVQYNGGVRADEFRLSSYGLPEPAGFGGSRSTPWYIWAAVLGFACLALGALLRWRARRAERNKG